MKILIVRHGEPANLPDDPISADSLGEWISLYDSASIRADSNPTEEEQKIVSAGQLLLSSDLKRSIDSVVRLSSGQPIQEMALCREVGLPYSNRKTFKLKPAIWAVLFRALWYLGYSKYSESRSEAKIRAEKAVGELISLAHKHHFITLVGHGIFNRFLAHELLHRGFSGPAKPNSRYWGSSMYERESGLPCHSP